MKNENHIRVFPIDQDKNHIENHQLTGAMLLELGPHGNYLDYLTEFGERVRYIPTKTETVKIFNPKLKISQRRSLNPPKS